MGNNKSQPDEQKTDENVLETMAVITAAILAFVLVTALLMRSWVGRCLDRIFGKPLDRMCAVLQSASNLLCWYFGTMFSYLLLMWQAFRHPKCSMTYYRWDRQEAYKNFIYFNLFYAILCVPVLMFDTLCEINEMFEAFNFNIFNIFFFNRWFMRQFHGAAATFLRITTKWVVTFLLVHGGYVVAEYGRCLCQGLLLLAFSEAYFDICFVLKCHTILTPARVYCAIFMALSGGRVCWERFWRAPGSPSTVQYTSLDVDDPDLDKGAPPASQESA